MKAIHSFSYQVYPNDIKGGYVHIYDDTTESTVCHTFTTSGAVDFDTLLYLYDDGLTAFHKDIDESDLV